MTTWHHYPLSHPWMSSRKRKASDSPNDSDNDNATTQSFAHRNLPHSKRRRFDLARNLSRLSLFEQAQVQSPISQEHAVFQGGPLPSHPPDQGVNIYPWSPPYLQEPQEDTSMDTDGAPPISVIHPIVEEPAGHATTISEVRMRNTSSYEPEKDRKFSCTPYLRSQE